LEIRSKCRGQFLSKEDKDNKEMADDAWRRVAFSRISVLNARMRRVANAASPGFNEGFPVAVANFLYWHLP
jgi:hypothetical protein